LRFSLFLLFFQKLSAAEVPFSAEILGWRQSRQRKNSEPLAVLSCFSAVLPGESERRRAVRFPNTPSPL
jgi:hypothetical protein